MVIISLTHSLLLLCFILTNRLPKASPGHTSLDFSTIRAQITGDSHHGKKAIEDKSTRCGTYLATHIISSSSQHRGTQVLSVGVLARCHLALILRASTMQCASFFYFILLPMSKENLRSSLISIFKLRPETCKICNVMLGVPTMLIFGRTS